MMKAKTALCVYYDLEIIQLILKDIAFSSSYKNKVL